MSRSYISELNDQLAHPKPDCRAERNRKKYVRDEARRKARLETLALDNRTCQFCGARDGVEWSHIDNRRPHNRELDAPENTTSLCGRIPGVRVGCHYIFDNGGKIKVDGKTVYVTADQFRLMTFEKHENEKTFRHAQHLRRLREKMGVGE